MGYSPNQDFIFGFRVPKEFEEEVYDFTKELGISYACAGESNSEVEDTFVGFELDTGEVVDENYLGGFHGNRFNLDYFNNWAKESQEKMTPELQQKIRETFSIEDGVEAELWTVSSCG